MTLKIDGVDITPYIAFRGVKWQRADVESESTTRTLDGTLKRNRVATKRRLDVTCRPLKTNEASLVLTAIMPVWVSVTYTDPQLGTDVTRTMYSNNNPASFLMKTSRGEEWWDGIAFPLIEK